MRGLPAMEAPRPLLLLLGLLGLLLLLGIREAGEGPLAHRQGTWGGVAEGQRTGDYGRGRRG